MKEATEENTTVYKFYTFGINLYIALETDAAGTPRYSLVGPAGASFGFYLENSDEITLYNIEHRAKMTFKKDIDSLIAPAGEIGYKIAFQEFSDALQIIGQEIGPGNGIKAVWRRDHKL